ncbi:type II toxin-antitoxin system RelE/ParE family toxin [Polaribacter sp.]|uniref:type II toxin-antitoxin system RelE/ParE family toxin n=1 Tax=Polaribacter sp. TaxID=1920175 RepID=UPI003EF56C14
MSLTVDWSLKAEKDLEKIFEYVKEKTLSNNLASNVVNDIFETTMNIHFINQFQIDEIIGNPYRRIIVRNYKVIYAPKNENEIRVFRVFNTHQNPENLTASNL